MSPGGEKNEGREGNLTWLLLGKRGEKKKQWSRGAWERGKCPNPQTNSHIQRSVGSAASRDFLGSPMHRLLAGEHF